jgi:hypothetical protein
LKEERVLGETLSVMVRGMRAWASKDLREVLWAAAVSMARFSW